MQIVQRYSVHNPYYKNNVNRIDSRYRTFQDSGPRGLMLHSVGCAQPSAKVFADSWNKSSAQVAVHAVLQADGTVYQCLPWNYRGIHCGGDGNNTHVGVEMTEPACIAYTSGANFTCSNLTAARAQARGCYETAVELFAQLCRQYGLDPMTAICSHAEGYQRGIASGHGDPEHLWRGLGLPYTMDSFRAAVKEAMQPKELYRIRRSWEDAQSQIGAYYNLDTAIAVCRPGYSVYDTDGNAVYSVPEEQEEELMTKEQILKELGDKYIARFDDLPEWAKPEVRPLLDGGYIKGTSADDPDDIGMFMSDIRTIIVCSRIVKGA